MCKKILVPLDDSPADETILPHVVELAKRFGSKILLLHVADRWSARNFDRLKLAESGEMENEREYLEIIATCHFRRQGISVSTFLAQGSPPAEILKIAEAERCDLIAMAGHEPRLLGDIFHGSTITWVRHRTAIPILVVRAQIK